MSLISTRLSGNPITKRLLIEWCGAETDLRPVCKIRDFFPPAPWKGSTPIVEQIKCETCRVRFMVLPRLLRSGDLYLTEAAIHYILGDTRMAANLFALRHIYITWVLGRGMPWSLQFPQATCVRRAFCSLLAGLHPQRFVGDPMCPRRLWKWTFKSAEKGDELINKEASFYFSSFLQAESPDITMKSVWSKPNCYD